MKAAGHNEQKVNGVEEFFGTSRKMESECFRAIEELSLLGAEEPEIAAAIKESRGALGRARRLHYLALSALLLKPFWTATGAEAIATVERLTSETLRISPEETPEELAEAFVAKYYGEDADPEIREQYVYTFTRKKRPN